MAREDRSGNDLILSRGPWEGGHAALPHSEKGKRAFAGRLVQAGMKKAAHRSLRRRETEAIDVIRGLSALGSFDRSAECRFSSNKRQRHRRRGHACNGEGHTSLPIIFCSHELRRKYMDHRFTGDLMKRFRNRLACLLDAKRSLAGHHRQSLSINFLSDRGIQGVLEMMMQMTIGWRFENFRFIDIEFNSVQNKKYRIKAYVLQCSGKMRLNIWRTTSSKFSNSIFSKTFFSFFFFRWKKCILYIFLLTFTCRIICWISRYLIWKFFKINFVWKWSVKRENYYFDLFLHVGSSSGAVLNVISFVNYFSIFHIIMKSMFKIKLFSQF